MVGRGHHLSHRRRGLGPQIGAQVTDFVIVLNTERAVRAFSKGGNVTLGADASVAAGPVGRAAEADVTPRAAIYTYQQDESLFIGASLEGAVIGTRKGANEDYIVGLFLLTNIFAGTRRRAGRRRQPACRSWPLTPSRQKSRATADSSSAVGSSGGDNLLYKRTAALRLYEACAGC